MINGRNQAVFILRHVFFFYLAYLACAATREIHSEQIGNLYVDGNGGNKGEREAVC